MTASQATIFQWGVCVFILYMVFVSLYLTWKHLRVPPQPPVPPQRRYNVVEEAERVLYAYQQSEVEG